MGSKENSIEEIKIILRRCLIFSNSKVGPRKWQSQSQSHSSHSLDQELIDSELEPALKQVEIEIIDRGYICKMVLLSNLRR